MKEREIETLMLAGGIGKRLESITGCNQPKCFVELQHQYTAFDYILEQLQKIGLTATWSADNYYYQYKNLLELTNHRMIWQKPGGIVEAIKQPGGTVLAIAVDCVFPYKDLPDMIAKHEPGTITWAVTKYSYPGMDNYRGMDITPNNAIIGRSDKSIIRAPVTIVDTELLKKFSSKPPSQGEGENFYFDVLTRIEKVNKTRIMRGEKSILNAYFLTGPVIYFGTPARLLDLKLNFKKVIDETNK